MSKARDLAAALNSTSSLIGASLSDPTTYAPSEVVGGGTDIVANPSLLPTSGNDAGDQYFVTSNNNLMIWNGSGWYKVATVTNTSPVINSAGNAAYNFAKDGTPIDIEISATDPEGLNVQYKYNVTAGTVGNIAAISSSATSGGTYSALAENTLTDNRFIRLTPSTNTAHAGSFSLTFSASDGVNIGSSTASSFSLTFETYGSAFFDGTLDSLALPASSDFALGTGDFTIECWVKFNDTSLGTGGANRRIFSLNASAGNAVDKLQICIDDGSYRTNGDLFLYSNSDQGYLGVDIRDEWHHIAVVRNSGTLKFYLDGSEKHSSSNTQDYSPNSGSPAPIIGQRGDDKGDYHGYISNFRMVVGTAVYTSNFTPTGPLGDITNTKLLTAHKNNEIVDGSSSSHTITKNGDVTAHASNPFPLNTIGYGSVKFDGTGDYVITNTSSDLVIGSNDFTAECWIYPKTFSGVQGLIDRRRSGDAANYDWTTYLNTDNTLNFYASGGTRITSSALSTNRWYHTAVIKKSGTTTLYVDGKNQGTWGDGATYPSNQMTFGAYGPSLASLWYDGYASNLRMVVGSDVYTPSTTASGLDLDNQNTTLSSHAGFDFGTDDFTVEFFFKWDSNSGYQTLIDHNYTSAGGFTLQSNTGTYKWGLWGDVSQQYESTNATQGVWHHYAIVRNSNTVKIYRDGVETLSKSHSGSVGSTNTTTFGHGTHSVDGKISNFRVVKGTALYTSAGFTIPTSNLTAISGTSLLLFQENSGSTLSDGSTNNYTVNIGSNSILTSDGPFYGQITVPTAPLTAVTNTKLLTLQRPQPDSITNGSYHFTTTSSRLTAEHADFNLSSGTPFTMEMWYKMTTHGNPLWDFGGGNAFQLYERNSDSHMWIYGLGGGYIIDFGTAGHDLNTWYHVAVTGDGSNNVKAYIDGTQVGSTYSGSWSITGNRIRLNGYAGSGYGNVGHVVYMSDVRLVNGTQVYTGNFTPPSGPLTTTGGTYPSNTNVNTSITASHTKLLTCQNSSGGRVDNSPTGHTLTQDGTVTPSAGIGNAATDQSSYSHALSQGGDARSAVTWPFNYNG